MTPDAPSNLPDASQGSDFAPSRAESVPLKCRWNAPFGRLEWMRLAGALAVSLLLLSASMLIRQLWSKQPDVLADRALLFTANAFAILGAIFLPVWAGSWRIILLSLLITSVFCCLSGLMEGSELPRVMRAAGTLIGVFGAIATIWISTPSLSLVRRLFWLLLVVWTMGFPLSSYLRADASGELDSTTTFSHFSFASLLR